MSSLNEFAQNELDKILAKCENTEDYNMQKTMNDDIMQVINIFCSQGHTGFSANYALNIIERLLRYLPISPLTGEDDEWIKLDYDERTCYQNKRCPAVFKDENGRAYYTEAKIFSADNGHTWFSSKDSSEYIEFPFEVPKHRESIIIDNKVERFNILQTIVNKINSMGVELSLNDINEDTKLAEILDDKEIRDLQEGLLHDFKIRKPLFDLTIKDCFWQVINMIMESDKEE